ncbi:RNA-binding domain-containing protein [Pseudomonas sp.]|uniref:RNA-binding domain-containing protein n=1 Tax=Pseudomonas sp. TaxID=306 RepID=UPI0019F2AEED|nr:RNA-binding domain-containing protein [Pseudomonas sp.]MBF0675109.1 putative DNA binding domain-containing protein [Pseudomonas sp.]MBF0677009.1 putative DNA binding domain-containing protein [Pseudomonas sp.]
MTLVELQHILACGEDSRHQFKRDFNNIDALAAELVAFANSSGGYLLIGVDDSGAVSGLSGADVGRLNQMLSNAASQNVKPAINPLSSNVQTEHGLVMVVTVEQGLNRPYVDSHGRIWVKNGADKRRVTAREELQRLFQQAGLVYADAVPVAGSSAADIDAKALGEYFQRRFRQSPEQAGLETIRTLENLGLASGGTPNLAGLLLFGQAPQRLCPAFDIKAVAFPGTVLHDRHYLDSEDIDGNLLEQYRRSLAFIKRNLRHVQRQQGFNTLGQLEVPEDVFEELLVNALIHRDYFVSASIRLMIFADRIELISPGHLPDVLDTEKIRYGLSNRRNPTLTSHAVHILPYRGLGTGIPRAIDAWPKIELYDDRQGNQFKVVIQRPMEEKGSIQGLIRDQVGAKSGPSRDQAEASPPLPQEQLTLLSQMTGDHATPELMTLAGRSNRSKFRVQVLAPLLALGLVEMTIPDKPNSSKQRYRLTQAGRALQAEQSATDT